MSKPSLRIPAALAVVVLSAVTGSCSPATPQEKPFCFCEIQPGADARVILAGVDAGFDDAGCVPPEQLQCEFV